MQTHYSQPITDSGPRYLWASALLLVRPSRFGYNPENADNTFAHRSPSPAPAGALQLAEPPRDRHLLDLALAEFDNLVVGLKDMGLEICVLRDSSSSPDAIFPNNWFSTHPEGQLVYYPMKAPSRRREVRTDLPDRLRQWGFEVKQILDWSGLAEAGLFLEGTGSLVLDATRRLVYAALSDRTEASLVERWAETLGYTPFCFEPCSLPGTDGQRHAIYHTNVLMAQGQGFVIWAPDGFANPEAAQQLRKNLAETDQFSLEITLGQVQAFAGNMLQVQTPKGPCLLMSQTAQNALLPSQIAALEARTAVRAFAIPTIERVGGGSLRCLLAELFLPRLA